LDWALEVREKEFQRYPIITNAPKYFMVCVNSAGDGSVRIPEKSIQAREQLGCKIPADGLQLERDGMWGSIPPGISVNAEAVLFPRVEKVKDPLATSADIDREKEIKSDLISFNQFKQIKLKVAQIISAERVPKADKLLKLKIDAGEGTSELVAGIAKQYLPETLVGKKIVIVANLKPAKIKGITSEGMLLAADGKNGPILLTVEDEKEVNPGARIS